MDAGSHAAVVWLGGRPVPLWRLLALAGVAAGTAWWMALAAATGTSVLLPLGTLPWLLAGFLGWTGLRRRLSGGERIVLLEHLALALGVGAAAAFAAGEPVLPALDQLASALCVLFTFGRVGCLGAGCCHGKAWAGAIPRRLGLRRVPTQLAEVGVWALLALGSAGVAVFGAPGAALAVVLGGYGPVRFALEWVRGDRRPRALGLTESQWIAAAAVAGAVALRPVSWGALALLASGAAVGAALWRTRGRWLESPAPSPRRVVERMRTLGPDDPPRTFPFGDVSVGLSRPREAPPGAVAVSVHRAEPPLPAAEAAAILGLIAAEGGGVVMGEILCRGATHLAFLAMPAGVVDADGGPAPARPAAGPAPDAERPDDYFGPVGG